MNRTCGACGASVPELQTRGSQRICDECATGLDQFVRDTAGFTLTPWQQRVLDALKDHGQWPALPSSPWPRVFDERPHPTERALSVLEDHGFAIIDGTGTYRPTSGGE